LPLVVTADQDLLDDLLRLAAAAGTEVDVATDPAAARRSFSAAPIVLITTDQAEPCLRARLPRRPQVVVVGREDETGPAFPIAELLGAEHVVSLPAAETWMINKLGRAHEPGNSARVLAVIGGRGGAGASILSGALAVTAVNAGRRTLLVDADPLGGGLDLVLGWETVSGIRWPDLAAADGRVDPPALLQALPHRGDLVLLSFTRDHLPAIPGEAMAATLDAARRGRDVVIADLPRQLDDAALLALQSADRAVLVVPAELRATASAARVAAVAAMHCDDLSVVVRGPAPGNLKARQVAQALGLPLAGSLRPEPGMCQALERGEAPAADGRGPLAALCKRLIRELTAGARDEAAA
jgi:secretion/DNA translocation related CpaE-like protein